MTSVWRRFSAFPSWLNTRLYIDIGSSMTRVVYQQKLIWHQPTCLAVDANGSVLQVGQAAFHLVGKVPQKISIVFPVHEGRVANVGQTEQYFKSVIRLIMPSLGLPLLLNLGGVVGLATSLSPVEHQTWQKVLKTAGFQNLILVTKSQALFQAVKKTKTSHDYLCLVDIGATTTELAIIAQNELLQAQTANFGGQRFTDALENVVRTEYQGISSQLAMEKIKFQQRALQFSAEGDKTASHKISLRVTDILTRSPKTVYLERSIIEQEFKQVSDELVALIQNFIADAPTEVATTLLERGIYLSGGGSLLAGLADYLQYALKLPVTASRQPELDVVWGLVEATTHA